MYLKILVKWSLNLRAEKTYCCECNGDYYWRLCYTALPFKSVEAWNFCVFKWNYPVRPVPMSTQSRRRSLLYTCTSQPSLVGSILIRDFVESKLFMVSTSCWSNVGGSLAGACPPLRKHLLVIESVSRRETKGLPKADIDRRLGRRSCFGFQWVTRANGDCVVSIQQPSGPQKLCPYSTSASQI